MLQDDIFSSFEKPEFKELLMLYEKMQEKQKSVYFETDELILIAEYYAKDKRVKESEKAIEYALRLHPEDTELHIYQAQALGARGEYEKASQLLDSLPDQNDREVLFTRATMYLNREMNNEAELLFNLLAENENFSSEVMVDIADVYMDNNQSKEAYYWLRRAYNQDSDNTNVKDALIDYYTTFGETEKAIVMLTNVLDDNPFNLNYWIELSHAYITNHDTAKAFEAIDFALAIDKKNARALETKAFIFFMESNHKKAIQLLEKIRSYGIDSMNSRQLLIQGYIHEKEYEKAVEYCNEILANELQDYEIAIFRTSRGYCNLMLGHIGACEDDMKIALMADKEYAPLYVVMGEYYLMKGDVQEAKGEFAYAEALAPERGDMLESIAFSFFRSGYFEDAKNIYLRLEKEFPELIKKDYYYLAYSLYYSNGKLDDIQTLLVKAAQNTPEILDYIIDTDFSENPEEEKFFKLAQIAKELVENGMIPPES